jgi:hypothetical protein
VLRRRLTRLPQPPVDLLHHQVRCHNTAQQHERPARFLLASRGDGQLHSGVTAKHSTLPPGGPP